MNTAVLSTIALTGFTVAFFHAAIPTHWLPFVLVSRSRGWSRSRTLAVVALAGLGHVALTTLLGLGVAWFGFQLDERVGRLFPFVIGGALLAIGLYFAWRQLSGHGVQHHHPPGGQHQESAACGHEAEHSHWEHELEDTTLVSRKSTDWAAVSGLFMMLTLSPCEGFLPIYLSGVRFGWHGFAVLSAILALGALGAMLLLTWLTLIGMERFSVQKFERFEAGLLGLIFSLLGVLVMVLER
jgi:nickel/cobalt transporter (NicO) family protein